MDGGGRSEGMGRNRDVKTTGQIGRAEVVDDFNSKQEEFESWSKFDWKPVEFLKDRGDCGGMRGF